jgi:SAM-dependent methyltransferase
MTKTSASRSSKLGERYAAHNSARGRGFLYGGNERLAALRDALGSVPAGWILDLGCRDGSLARALELPPGRTVGADIDPIALAAAVEENRLRPMLADLWSTIPLRDASVDLVVGGEVLEHVPFPADLIEEVARVLKPGGAFIGSVPNAFRLKNRLTFLSGRWFEVDPTHLRQFSPSSLDSLLSDRFARVRIRPCVGRYANYWPRMLGNDLVWSAVRK